MIMHSSSTHPVLDVGSVDVVCYQLQSNHPILIKVFYDFNHRQVTMMSTRGTESMIRDLQGGEAEVAVGAEVEVQGRTFKKARKMFISCKKKTSHNLLSCTK